jgi:methionine salvage enolase-phosphatase E1
MTRGELSVIITKLTGESNQYFNQDTFTDTAKHWARYFVEEAYRNKIISGYSDKTFQPNKEVTRAEAVTVINKILYRGPLDTEISTFKDVEKNHWAKGYIEEAATNHIYIIEKDGREKIDK